MKGLLLGEAARDQTSAKRSAVRLAEPDEVVRESSTCCTMYVGPRSLLVAARIDLADGVDASRIEEMSRSSTAGCARPCADVSDVFLDPTPSRATARRSG